jgi:hypothetical protein
MSAKSKNNNNEDRDNENINTNNINDNPFVKQSQKLSDDNSPNNDLIIIQSLISKTFDGVIPIGIKYGSNSHPMLKVWLTVLSLTGAPVLFIALSNNTTKCKKLKRLLSLIFSFILLIIYHILFFINAAKILKSEVKTTVKYYSVWLKYYPLLFNLSVILVNDVMWTIGLINKCWVCDILEAIKEKPPQNA